MKWDFKCTREMEKQLKTEGLRGQVRTFCLEKKEINLCAGPGLRNITKSPKHTSFR